jgi:periplasmic nitrate reductase NapD
MANHFNVSSLIVWVSPGQFMNAKAGILAMRDVEIQRSDKVGKLVVDLATTNRDEVGKRMRAIEALPGILNVALIYNNVVQIARSVA